MWRIEWLTFCLMACLFGFVPAVNAEATESMPSTSTGSEDLVLERLPGRELESRLASWLKRDFEQAGSLVQVELIGSWGGLPLVLTDARASVIKQTRVADGWQVSVTVKAIDQQGVESKFDLRFKVRSLHSVWVASAPMRKGAHLNCELFQPAQRSGRSASMAWRLPCESLEGLQLRKPLAAGDVLMTVDVGKPVAVQEQQEAVVTAQLGGIQVQGVGVVLSDAHVGQMVTVRMSGQTTVVQGLVTAPGRIQVMGEAR
jgi:flagella basal body P-ring formation protein FlgA